MAEKKLSVLQQRFVDEYVVDWNATQAAIRAGYSKKTAYSQGQRLLKKAEIQKAVQKALQRFANRSIISKEKIVEELAKNALREASDLQDSEFKHTSKTRYLDMLCKCFGMYIKAEPDREDSQPDDGFLEALKGDAGDTWQE